MFQQSMLIKLDPNVKRQALEELRKEFFDGLSIKSNKEESGLVCRLCGRDANKRPKYLDKRLVEYLYKIYDHTKERRMRSFDPKVCLPIDQNTQNDFQKLHYWNFIERSDQAGVWNITNHGIQFVKGQIQVPKKVWVFDNVVVLEDDILVDVKSVDPRWQIEHADYSQDYSPAYPSL